MESCAEFDQFILRKIIENCCHQMSYFEAKMHQSRFRLGLRPLGELTALTRTGPPSWNSRGAPNKNLTYATMADPWIMLAQICRNDDKVAIKTVSYVAYR